MGTAGSRSGEGGEASGLFQEPGGRRNAGERLHSWKEIAAYLKHGVRTVQRWEQTEDLPVHRHPHERRDAVYAYPAELDAWWTSQRSRLEKAEPQSHSVLSRRLWPRLGLAIGVATLAAAIWLIRSIHSPALPFERRDWILVTDFDNQTGDPIFDRSLSSAFSVGLEQSSHANVVPRVRVNAALKRMGKSEDTRVDQQLGREICLRDNVKALVSCSIARSGREFALSARLIEPGSGAAVRSYLEMARDQDHVIDALGKIANRIRKDLGESLAALRQSSEPLPQVTTSSLQALKSYAEGNDLWRKGRYREAVRLYEAALEEDPGFAMAHSALGIAFTGHVLNFPTRGKEHFEKALRLSDRVTPRERLCIRASYESGTGRLAEAIDSLRLYLQMFPDDALIRYNLGTLLMRSDRCQEAIEELKESLRLFPANGGTLVNLASSYLKLGQVAQSQTHFEKAFEVEPALLNVANLNHEYGFVLVRAGKASKAREVFSRALANPETKATGLRSLALLDMYEGNFRRAARQLEQAIALNQIEGYSLPKARNQLFLAFVFEALGDRLAHLRELDRAWKSLESVDGLQSWLLTRIGAAYARAGETNKAARILARLETGAHGDNKDLQRDRNQLVAELELATGNPARAVASFRLAAIGENVPLSLDGQGRAWEKAGDKDQAIASYEGLLGLPYTPLGWEAQQPWLAAHVRLAGLYLARGDFAKAHQSLDSLSSLWKEADPSLPLVKSMAQIRKRLLAAKR